MKGQTESDRLRGQQKYRKFLRTDPKVVPRAAVKEISGNCRVAKLRQTRFVAAYHQGAFLRQTAPVLTRAS
jgi:hypothetical protein